MSKALHPPLVGDNIMKYELAVINTKNPNASYFRTIFGGTITEAVAKARREAGRGFVVLQKAAL